MILVLVAITSLIVGIIIGLLLALLWMSVALNLPEPAQVSKVIKAALEPKKTGAIFHAPADDLYAFQSKLKQDDQNNKDTSLDDL